MNLLDKRLMYSAENGLTVVVKKLIEDGANVNAEDDCAIRWASENGHAEVVKLLKQYSKR